MIKAPIQSDGTPPENNDPSFNVLGVLAAESKYQDRMRDAFNKFQEFSTSTESKFQNYARESESKMQTWMRDAETRRLDERSHLQQVYEARIADMLSESVKSTSSLVSTQLVQIQSTFDARVSKLEEFRLLSTGRSSVADPALAATLEALGRNITSMQSSFSKTMNDFADKNSVIMEKMSASIISLQEAHREGAGKSTGRGEVIAWIVAGIMLVAAIGTPIVSFIITKSH